MTRSPRLLLALAAVAVAFAAADTYVVVLALPEMMAGVGLSADELQRAAGAAAATWKRFRNDGRASTRQQWVADVMVRSCERAWVDASQEVRSG